MIIAAVLTAFVVGTVFACALVRGAHLGDPPERFEPILRARPKRVDYTEDGVR